MDFDLTERAPVERVKKAMQMSAQLLIEAREELCELLLCDGRGEINIPDGQAGKRLGVTREQAVQERGAAAQIPDDEQRLFDTLCFVTGEKDIIQKETEPVDELADRPDCIKKQKEDDSFTGQTGRGIF